MITCVYTYYYTSFALSCITSLTIPSRVVVIVSVGPCRENNENKSLIVTVNMHAISVEALREQSTYVECLMLYKHIV